MTRLAVARHDPAPCTTSLIFTLVQSFTTGASFEIVFGSKLYHTHGDLCIRTDMSIWLINEQRIYYKVDTTTNPSSIEVIVSHQRSLIPFFITAEYISNKET